MPVEIVKVKQRIQKAEFRGKLLGRKQIRRIESGEDPFNRGTVIWHDLTAYVRDDDGDIRELPYDEIEEAGLSFDTEHVLESQHGVSRIKGKGTDSFGEREEWEQEENSGAGFGYTAWADSLGFNVRVTLHEEGDYDCRGSVAGISAGNRLSFRVR